MSRLTGSLPTGSPEVFLPPDPIFASAMSETDDVLCAQLQCFHFPTLRHHDLHSWHAESCAEKSSFLCKRSKSRGQPPVGPHLVYFEIEPPSWPLALWPG